MLLPERLAHCFRRYPRLECLLGDGWRFLLAGGFNTLFTFLLYQALLWVASEKTAWTLAWLAGIALISVLYPRKVFQGGQLTLGRVLLNGLYYGCAYVISLGLLTVFVGRFGVNPRLAGLFVLFVTVPLNFIMSRIIFTWKGKSRGF